MTDATELDEAAVRAATEACLRGFEAEVPAHWYGQADVVARALRKEYGPGGIYDADAAFIVACSPSVVLAALDEITRLRAALDEARADHLCACGYGVVCGQCQRVDRARAEAAEKERLLTSSAPATASEGATLSDSDTDSVTASEGAREDFCLACLVDGVELDHARCPLAPEHVAQAEKPSCVCPTDDYCPRCHPRWYANWIATGVTSSDGDRGLGEEVEAIVRAYGDPVTSAGRESLRDTVRALVDLLAARAAQPEGVERVECDHPGIEHGPFSATGICPKCRHCKFIGHGPLCVDCFAPVSAEEVVGDE